MAISGPRCLTAGDIEAFSAWLRRCGAEVLAPTNPYELLRFRARGGTHVIYRKASGHVGNVIGFPKEAIEAWRGGRPLDMGITTKQRLGGDRVRAALLERDGRDCFYCLEPMPNDDMTIEHLVSVDKGGPSHHDNLVLAHLRCNQAADNLPLVKKIKMREGALGGAWER